MRRLVYSFTQNILWKLSGVWSNFGFLLNWNRFLPDAVVDELVAVSVFASLALFRLEDLPGTQLIVDDDPPLLLLALLLLWLLFFDFQSFIFMALNKITHSQYSKLFHNNDFFYCYFMFWYRNFGFLTYIHTFFENFTQSFCSISFASVHQLVNKG